MPRATIQFGLTVAGYKIEAEATVRGDLVPVKEVLPVLHGIGGAVVNAFSSRATAESGAISCRAGCGACCRQMVPIAEVEALYLAELVDAMPEERREEIRARFARAVDAFARAGLLEDLRSVQDMRDPAERQKLALRYFHTGIACPFLEDESCSIHPQRPMSCREYLVTSPAEHCANPSADTVKMVQISTKPSVALFRFGDAKGEDRPRYLPLVLALEWVRQHADDAQSVRLGPSIIQDFLRALGGEKHAEVTR